MIQEEVCRGHRTGPRIPIYVQRRRTPFYSQAQNARASHADRPLAWVATIQQAPGNVVRRYNVATNDCWEGQDRIFYLLSRCVDRQGCDSAIHIMTQVVKYPEAFYKTSLNVSQPLISALIIYRMLCSMVSAGNDSYMWQVLASEAPAADTKKIHILTCHPSPRKKNPVPH